MTRYVFTDPDGDALVVEEDDGDALVTVQRPADMDGMSIIVPAQQVPEVAQGFVTALYEAVGLPVPELAAQDGADTSGQARTVPDGDWVKYVAPGSTPKAWAAGSEFE